MLIPSFAIGRTQQVLYYIAEFIREGQLPRFPIYLDSPMAIKAMALYRTHRDLFDEEAAGLVKADRFTKDLSELHYTETSDESRALNNLRGMAVIIAGSGMCEGGRIVHHLKPASGVPAPRSSSSATSPRARWAATSSMARRVRIFGEEIGVEAGIHTLGGFSAHAGQTELADWAGNYLSGPTRPRVVLTHGEDRPRETLRRLLLVTNGGRASRTGDVLCSTEAVWRRYTDFVDGAAGAQDRLIRHGFAREDGIDFSASTQCY